MKQKTRSKFLTTLNIILLVLLFAIPAYAYWANVGANKDTQAGIQIGEGQNAGTITLTDYETNGVLVPKDKAVGDQVESIEFELTFRWTETTEDLVGATGDFNLEVEPSHKLLKVDLEGVPETVELNTDYTINVKVTLTEPADLAQYNEVANQVLTITFNMEITNVVPN